MPRHTPHEAAVKHAERTVKAKVAALDKANIELDAANAVLLQVIALAPKAAAPPDTE